MHNPSISILGPGPDVMLIEGFDCIGNYASSTAYCIAGHKPICADQLYGKADNAGVIGPNLSGVRGLLVLALF